MPERVASWICPPLLRPSEAFGLVETARNSCTESIGRFPIVTNADLNADGITNDLPVGLERNAGRAPGFFNVDARYSRVIPITERFRVEVFAEATNIFNINSTVSYGSTTITNTGTPRFNTTTGVLLVPVDELYNTVFTRTAQESRQGQFGVKFIF